MAENLYGPDVELKDRRTFEAFRRYVLPALGVIESIATQGKSPGSTAMGAEQVFQQQEDRRRQFLAEENARQNEAIERALKKSQTELYGEQLAGARGERERGERLAGEWETAVEAEPGLSAVQRAMKKGAGAKATQSTEAGLERLLETLSSREVVAGQNIKSREEIANERNELMEFIALLNAGTKKDIEAQRTGEKREKTATNKQEIVDIITEIENDPGFSTGLNPKRVAQKIPGSPEFSFLKKVENLKGRLALDQRQMMKGQGQISDYESKMLERAVSMLDMGLGEKDFRKELNRIKEIMQSATPEAPGQGQTKPSASVPAQKTSGPQPGTVEGGYRFRGGDPAKPENWEMVQ
jgi:hypothetical protein